MPEKLHNRFKDDDDDIPKRHQDENKVDQTSKKKEKKRKRDENQTSHSSSATRRLVSPSTNRDHGRRIASAPNHAGRKQQPQNGKPRKDWSTFSDRRREYSATSSRPNSLKDKAQALYASRKKLPVFRHADEIRDSLKDDDGNVLLIVGETGSGKSTQVPQFLVSQPWCKSMAVRVGTNIDGNTKEQQRRRQQQQQPQQPQPQRVGGRIAITQPRRVAAISLARRVAEEMGTPLGSSSPASRVGYSVRFDNSTSPSTKIKFLTEGMLLQEMLGDPWLREYSAIVVDEVHERSVNVDLILGFMRRLLAGSLEGRGGVPLKVVVMSATAEMEAIEKFFEEDFEDENSRKYQALDGSKARDRVEENAKEEEGNSSDSSSEWNGFSDDEAQTDAPKPNESSLSGSSRRVHTCHITGRQFPVQITYDPGPVVNILDAALEWIFKINYKEPLPGDILVFLTGQELIENLQSLVNGHASGLDKSVPRILVLPLFAALSQVAQQKVFDPAPRWTRKVILSTNIAETSVTVPGVRHVIDCGKAKRRHFHSKLGLDTLLEKPISRSAAVQRAGRAGREAPGHCYRLYTEKEFLSLPSTDTPEILRCDMSQTVLTIVARGVRVYDLPSFRLLSSPSRDSLEKALEQLFYLDALDRSGSITQIGLQIAKLPLSARLARVILSAADPQFDCLAEVIDIISCLSVENVFLNSTSEEKREEAEEARKDLFRREGDHLTLLATIQAYASDHVDRKAWTEKHFISHRAMKAAMAVRKDLLARCKSAQLLPSPPDHGTPALTPKHHNQTQTQTQSPVQQDLDTIQSILKAFLTGFALNTATLNPDGSYRTLAGNHPIRIHPSSVLFGRKVETIMYDEFVFTTQFYARGVSAVQLGWVEDVFSGKGKGRGKEMVQ